MFYIHPQISARNPTIGFEQHHLELRGMEERLWHLANSERIKRGLLPLRYHPELAQVALQHSRKMAKNQKLSHYFPQYPSLSERLEQANIFFKNNAENVAFSTLADIKNIHDKLMSSASHRSNILNQNFSHCGIGFIK